jgi:hypothetical protein
MDSLASASAAHKLPVVSVSSMTESDLLDEINDVSQRFNGSLYVGRDYRGNPMAYNDISSSVVQSGIKPPVDPITETAQAASISVELSAAEFASAMAVRHDVCSIDAEVCQSVCISNSTESASNVKSHCCVNSIMCENPVTPSAADSAMLPSVCQVLSSEEDVSARLASTDRAVPAINKCTVDIDRSVNQLSGNCTCELNVTGLDEACLKSSTASPEMEVSDEVVCAAIIDDSQVDNNQSLQNVDRELSRNVSHWKEKSDANLSFSVR